MNHRFTVTAAIASLAASVALLPLVSGGKWFFGGLGAIIVVALVGTATRHRALRALPAVVCLLCALVALAVYLNLIYAASYSYIHLIPSPRSLSELWHSAVTALRATKSQAPPVPGSVGINLVAGAGIGLVAALTDLIAVRLRRCALAGLPLLVLFSVPIATDKGGNTTENTLVFCLGMAGYLALLSTDGRERLRLWGRLVTPWNAGNTAETADELGAGPSLRALAASGRRIGFAAVVLALLAPLLIPGLHAQKLFAGGSDGKSNSNGNGPGGTNASVNPVTRMAGDLRQNPATDLFTYVTNDPNPQYLVEEVLGNLTDIGASAAPPGPSVPLSSTNGLPPVPGLVSGNWPTVRTAVTMAAAQTLSNGYLPVPYAPRQITVSRNTVRVDKSTLMVATPLSSLTNLRYTVLSQDVTPNPAQFDTAPATLKPTGMGYYLEVPKQLKSLSGLARQIVGDASTPYDEAGALQNWFQTPGKFTYDVTQNLPNNPHALYDFLTVSRTGYCQQFSFAMTVLARLLGIPARVAVGFEPGHQTSKGHYRVDGSDAHAWVQLYFSGFGWTTWDPTPSGNGVGQTDEKPPLYSVPSTGSGTKTGGSKASSLNQAHSSQIRENERRLLSNGGGGAAPPPVHHNPPAGSSLPIVLIVLGALLAIALVSPRIVRSVTRRRRWLAARDNVGMAHAAWAELLDDLVDYGVGHGPGETARNVAKRIGTQQRLAPGTREALTRLAQAEERATYSPEPTPGEGLSSDVATVRIGLAASVTRSPRWRARLMPASATEEIRRIAAHALDAFDWLEVAIARLIARLPHPRTSP